MKKTHTVIAIIGDGGWGTTLAIHLAKKKYHCHIWGAFPKYLAQMEVKRENEKFLPGFHIPEEIIFEPNLNKCIEGAHLVVLAVPAQFLSSVVKKIDPKVSKNKKFVCVSKGIERKSYRLMSQILHDELKHSSLAVLSGPTIAREVAMELPTAVVVASKSAKLRIKVRELMSSNHFTVYESTDIIGVELGGALKNVIAIAAGIVDGLGYGSNTKSVLIARGIAEMARLGNRMGAKRSTFMGLSGLGDLTTTCFSIHSRNHGCGVRLGQGETIQAIYKSTEMVIEGIETTKSAFYLAKKYKINMPIIESVYKILFQAKSPRSTIEALMHKKHIKETD